VRTASATIIAFLALAGTGAIPQGTRSPAGRTLRVTATAYCLAGRTQSGARARSGVIAADPSVLPVGSVVRIIEGPHAGIYTVMDTGPAVKGRKIDIFMSSCQRAEKFGEQKLRIRVLRHGWDPKTSNNF
jgi:3D (Asp-Asp-Asp) domain-containing protein